MKYSTEIALRNPYKIESRLPFFLHAYSCYPNYAFRHNGLLKYPLFLISILSRFIGFLNLKSNSHRYIEASYEGAGLFEVRTTNSQFHSIYFEAFRSMYEPEVAFTIQLFLKHGGVFYDVGANWGHHTFYAALKRNASVVAFEPNPTVSADIARISKQLGLDDRIEVIESAISDSNEEVELTQSYFESGIASIDAAFVEQRKAERYISLLHKIFRVPPIKYLVKCRLLDEFNSSSVDLIKIDVEGVELNVLRGARNFIRKYKPAICFEFHSDDLSKFGEFIDLFKSYSYQLYKVSVVPSGTLKYEGRIVVISLESLQRNTQYNLVALPLDYDLEGVFQNYAV